MSDIIESPVLLITLGPTGSGKSSIPKKVAGILGLSNPEFVEVLIDNLVENHPTYKSDVKKFIDARRQKYKEQHPGLSDDEINTNLINKFTSEDIDNTIEFFNNTYYKTRNEVNCTQTNTNSDNIITCNRKNDSIFKDAMDAGKNVVFETTGESYPNWIFTTYKQQIIASKYQIVFAMNVVEICDLIQRNYNRAKHSLEEFINDPNKPAPRLPDMKFETFRAKIEQIVTTFNTNVYNASCDKIYDGCQIRKFVFDNNSYNGQTLYDSDTAVKDLSVETILAGYELNKRTCAKSTGGKRNSRRNNKNKQTRKRKSKNNRRKNTRRR